MPNSCVPQGTGQAVLVARFKANSSADSHLSLAARMSRLAKSLYLSWAPRDLRGGRERHALVCLGLGMLCALAVETTTRLPLRFGSGFCFGVESVEFEPSRA